MRLVLPALMLLAGTGSLFAQSAEVQKRCEERYAAAKSAGAIGELTAEGFVLMCSVVLAVTESAPRGVASSVPEAPTQGVGSAVSEPPAQVVGSIPTAGSTTYSDVVAYCKAVKNADRPDKRYTGPAFPAAVTKAVGASARWRCVDGTVYGCAADKDERKCLRMRASKTPTAAIQKYCVENPNAHIVPPAVSTNSSSTWRCGAGFAIVLETSRTDQRGYVRGAWQKVSP